MANDESGLDVAQLRADTLGCTEVIHLNNAGSSLPPSIVVDTMVEHLRLEEIMGGYEAHARASERIDTVRHSIGALLDTSGSNIALSTSATDSWDRAFSAITFAGDFGPDTRILASSSEYASNVLPVMQLARHHGVQLEFIPDDNNGVTDVAALESMLDDDVAAVLINHCPSQNGLINPVAAIGHALARAQSNAWYLVDACQSVGQLPVDAISIGADFLSVTGRKFVRGPRGTGFMYCSARALAELEPFPADLHGANWNPDGYSMRTDAQRFEAWEKSYAALLGLGAAVDYSLALGMDAIRMRVDYLSFELRLLLAEVSGVRVLDRGIEKSGIVTFNHERVEAAEIVAGLKHSGINVSMGTPEYSQVDYIAHEVSSLVRVSPHVFNTREELERCTEIVRGLTN
jgi:cysteine desulfurase / selenocysteine lyase